MRFKLSECKAGQSRGIAQAAEADTCLIHQALSVRRLILEQEYSSVAQCGKGVQGCYIRGGGKMNIGSRG